MDVILLAETVRMSILTVHFYTFPLSFLPATEARRVPSKAIGAAAAASSKVAAAPSLPVKVVVSEFMMPVPEGFVHASSQLLQSGISQHSG